MRVLQSGVSGGPRPNRRFSEGFVAASDRVNAENARSGHSPQQASDGSYQPSRSMSSRSTEGSRGRNWGFDNAAFVGGSQRAGVLPHAGQHNGPSVRNFAHCGSVDVDRVRSRPTRGQPGQRRLQTRAVRLSRQCSESRAREQYGYAQYGGIWMPGTLTDGMTVTKGGTSTTYTIKQEGNHVQGSNIQSTLHAIKLIPTSCNR